RRPPRSTMAGRPGHRVRGWSPGSEVEYMTCPGSACDPPRSLP
ncbi:hypothetical protein ZOSMA_3436G00010, partial [Zostera marina]